MALALVTAAEAEPFTFDEAIEHLRVDGTADSAYIFTLIRAAKEQAESITKRALMRQTWKYLLDEVPECGVIEVPKAPLSSVTHVKYYDDDGTQQTWSSALYTVDIATEPGRLMPIYGGSWPSYRLIPNTIEVQFVCGYVSADRIPLSIIQAMRLLMGHYYENREEVGFLTPSRLPAGVMSLLAPYVVPPIVL